MTRQQIRGYLFVIASAIIFGCMPLGAKFIYSNGVNSISLVFYRNLLALPITLLIVKRGGESLAVSQNDFLRLLILSLLGCALTPALMFSAYHYISSGLTTTLHFIYPAAVILGETLFFKEKLHFRQAFCVGLCLLGMSLFYSPGGGINFLGILLALLSGITYAAYIVLLSRFQLEHISGFKFTLYLSALCSMSLAVVCVPTKSFTLPNNPTGWLACFAFSLILSLGAVVLFRQGTMLIGGQRASILSTFEPITSIFIGISLFHEPFGWRTAAGTLLILAATILIAVFDSKKTSAEAA